MNLDSQFKFLILIDVLSSTSSMLSLYNVCIFSIFNSMLLDLEWTKKASASFYLAAKRLSSFHFESG